jgi:hypothetical protein
MSDQVASLFATIGADTSQAISEVGKFVNSLKKSEKDLDLYSDKMQKALGLDKGMVGGSFDQWQKEQTKSTNSASDSLAKLGKQVLTVAAAYKAAKWVADATKEYVAYANEVRDVARLTGASAEESSRLIQVAEQVGVTTNTLTTSMQMAIKKGYEPTIAGLMLMSQEYNSLATAQEKVLYLQNRFTRSGSGGGAGMAPLLEMGPEAIGRMGAGVAGSLILSSQDLFQARQTQFMMNDLENAYKGVQVATGSSLGSMAASLFAKPETKVRKLLEYANELKAAGASSEIFTQQMGQMAGYYGLVINKSGELVTSDGQLSKITRTLSSNFMELANAQGNTIKTYEQMSDAEKEAYVDEQNLNIELQANSKGMLLKHSISSDGTSVARKYKDSMHELMEKEKEYQDVLDWGNRHSYSEHNKKMKEAKAGLEATQSAMEDLNRQFEQQFKIGFMESLTAGGKNGTPDTAIKISAAMGLIDQKTFGIESAMYGISDSWDGATDGIIDYSKWTDKTYDDLERLSKAGLEATLNLPEGGEASFYYNIIVRTFYAGQNPPSGYGNMSTNEFNAKSDVIVGMHGGSFIGMQHGGIVPPGYGNDGMPIFISSGERVDVTPAGNVNKVNKNEGGNTLRFYGPVTFQVSDMKTAKLLEQLR